MFDIISIGACIAELAPQQPGASLANADCLQLFPAGSSANFSFAAARLGLKIALASRVGQDELGEFMLTRLQRGGVDTSHVLLTPNQLTSLSVCRVDGKGKKFFYLYRFPGFSNPLDELTSADLDDSFLTRARLLHFSEACVRESGIRSAIFEIAERFCAHGGRILYCPNYRGVWRSGREEMLRVQRQTVALANLLILNDEEATIITEKSAAEAGPALLAMGPEAVVITKGQDGARLFTAQGDEFVSAFQVPVIYDVGAGDTFQAGFAAGITWGKSYLESVRIGAAAAALRISRSGDPADLPTAEEVSDFLRQFRVEG